MNWLKIPYRAAWRLVMVDEGLELSGYIAFAAFLSLFPFLIFLASLAGFLGDRETANDFIQAMFHFMPDDVAETLAPAVREVVGVRERGLLTFSILATLWFASSGVEALRSGLNRAYSVTEERAIWWLRLQSIAFVVASSIIIFFLSLVVILGPLVWRVLGAEIHEDVDRRILFLILRYGIAVGTSGYAWKGSATVGRMARWPAWYPTDEMRRDAPGIPARIPPGDDNPLGARAMNLGATVYRIHGTNAPQTIGQAVSSGCFRLVNDDVVDLYDRVPIGTKVVVQHQ